MNVNRLLGVAAAIGLLAVPATATVVVATVTKPPPARSIRIGERP